MASKAEFSPIRARQSVADGSGAPANSLACVPRTVLEHDIAAWDALADRAAEPNPFFESWYLLPSLRAFDPHDRIRLIRFEVDGELAGLIPISHTLRYYRWPLPNCSNWLHQNCFLGAPLVARGTERAFWRSFLAWADSDAGAGLFLHLAQLPLAGPLHEALTEVLAEQSRPAVLVHREERAMLCSSQTPDAYFQAALSGKKRKELRRQFSRLSELGEARFERRNDTHDIDRWIDDFLALEASGWKGRAASALASDPATAGLFRESLKGAAARGRLERLSLSLDDRPVAMLVTFLTAPGAFSFKTAFDECFARFSPGVLLQRENLAILARGDIAWSDSCASADHPMIDHIWRERRAVGRMSIAIGGAVRRAIFHQIARAELARNPAGLEP